MFKFFSLPQAELEGPLLTQLTTPQLQNLAGVNRELRQSCKAEFVGRQKIFNLVKTRIAAGDLSITQQKHLSVVNTIDEIARDVNKYIPNDPNEGINMKIKQIVTRTAPEKIVGLNLEEVTGIEAGLTREQVQTPNFDYEHVAFVQTHGTASFAQISGLRSNEVLGIAAGLTREQVQTPNFDYEHVAFVQTHGTASFAQISGLRSNEVLGIAAGLTREQVQTPNFDYEHVVFVQTYGKEFFARIAGLNYNEIRDVETELHHKKQIQAPNFRCECIILLKKLEMAALASIANKVADEIIRETEIYEQKHSPCLIL